MAKNIDDSLLQFRVYPQILFFFFYKINNILIIRRFVERRENLSNKIF